MTTDESQNDEYDNWNEWFTGIAASEEANNLLLFSALKDKNSTFSTSHNINFKEEDWSNIENYLDNHKDVALTSLPMLGSKYIKINFIDNNERQIHIFVERPGDEEEKNNVDVSNEYGLSSAKKGAVLIYMVDSEFVFVSGFLEDDRKREAISYITKEV